MSVTKELYLILSIKTSNVNIFIGVCSYFRITDILFEIKEKSMFSSGDPSNTRKQSLEDILKAAVLSSVKYRDLRGFLRLTDSILDIVQNEIVSAEIDYDFIVTMKSDLQ